MFQGLGGRDRGWKEHFTSATQGQGLSSLGRGAAGSRRYSLCFGSGCPGEMPQHSREGKSLSPLLPGLRPYQQGLKHYINWDLRVQGTETGLADAWGTGLKELYALKRKRKQKTCPLWELFNSDAEERILGHIPGGELGDLKAVPASVLLPPGGNNGVGLCPSRPSLRQTHSLEEKYLEKNLQWFASLAFSGRDKSCNCYCDPLSPHILIRLGKTQLCIFSYTYKNVFFYTLWYSKTSISRTNSGEGVVC